MATLRAVMRCFAVPVLVGGVLIGRLTGLAAEGRGDLAAEPLGHFRLGHLRPVLHPLGGDQVDAVVVAAEGRRARRDVVGEDPVAAFAGELGAALLDYLLGLGREERKSTRLNS